MGRHRKRPHIHKGDGLGWPSRCRVCGRFGSNQWDGCIWITDNRKGDRERRRLGIDDPTVSDLRQDLPRVQPTG